MKPLFLVIFILLSQSLFAQDSNKLSPIAYWDFNNNSNPESSKDIFRKFEMAPNSKFVYDRFGVEKQAIYNPKITVKIENQDTINFIDSFSIGFWFKSNENNSELISYKSEGVLDLLIRVESGLITMERHELLGKKISYAKVCNSKTISDSKWHYVTLSFVNLTTLIIQVDDEQSYKHLNIFSKKNLSKILPSDYCGTISPYNEIVSSTDILINFENATVDELLITNKPLNKNIIEEIYSYNSWDELTKYQGVISNCDFSRKIYTELYKNEPMNIDVKGYSSWNVEFSEIINNTFNDPWYNYWKYGRSIEREWPNCDLNYFLNTKNEPETFKLKAEFLPGQGGYVIEGGNEWMTKNLDVSRFRNGDEIKYAQNAKEWEIAGSSKIPCWTYSNMSDKNSDKLYNYYAVIDKRGLAPLGYTIASKDDWTEVFNFLPNAAITDTTIFYNKLSRVFPGYLDSKGYLNEKNFQSYYWTSDASMVALYSRKPQEIIFESPKSTVVDSKGRFISEDLSKYSYGLIVKCVKEKGLKKDSEVRTYRFPSGNLLTGKFDNGYVNGPGKFVCENYTYVGDFKDSKIHGAGVMNKKDGTVYKGTWEDGKLNGIITETQSNGNTERWLWVDDSKIAKEGTPNFEVLTSLSPLQRKLVMLNGGSYVKSISGNRYRGGSVGSTDIYFETDNTNGYLNICSIGVSAGNKGYTTNNCISLEAFNVQGDKVFLEFSGSINMRKDNYSINSAFNSKGKIERHIEYNGSSSIPRTINLQLETTISGQILSFRVCFKDDYGNPDCGSFSPYGGRVNRLP
jgi:hypothetical protein